MSSHKVLQSASTRTTHGNESSLQRNKLWSGRGVGKTLLHGGGGRGRTRKTTSSPNKRKAQNRASPLRQDSASPVPGSGDVTQRSEALSLQEQLSATNDDCCVEQKYEMGTFPPPLIVSPATNLVFHWKEGSQNTEADIHLTNNCQSYVAYKVLSNAPSKYTVKPRMGLVEPLTTTTLTALAKQGRYDCDVSDKFLLMCREISKSDAEEADYNQIFADVPRDDVYEHQLCIVFGSRPKCESDPGLNHVKHKFEFERKVPNTRSESDKFVRNKNNISLMPRIETKSVSGGDGTAVLSLVDDQLLKKELSVKLQESDIRQNVLEVATLREQVLLLERRLTGLMFVSTFLLILLLMVWNTQPTYEQFVRYQKDVWDKERDDCPFSYKSMNCFF